MAIQTPGAFFLGTLVPNEQKYLKTLLDNAKKAGYNRFVEPCAGAFAMSHLAVQSGFKPEQIEASDVTMFSSIYGYAIMDKPLDDLEIHAEGFSDEELSDPAIALYALMVLKTTVTAGSDFFYAMLKDLYDRKAQHIKKINEQLDRAKSLLKGFNYRPYDMYDHLDEVMNDEKTLIFANPPTYKAGFEKWYDTRGAMTWKEPHYNIFDPVTGLSELMQDRMANKKALIVCYEENSAGAMAGQPIFARYGVRKGINVYLTTNDENKAVSLAEGKLIVRPSEKDIKPLDCSILPNDYVLTEKSKIEYAKIDGMNAQYYRSIWTHNFVGSAAQINLGIFIDGYIAGVLGFQLSIGGKLFDDILIMYGMTPKHNEYRLNRLLTMIAINRQTLQSMINDYQLKFIKGVQTVQMTKYPESKEMRGIMKMKSREKGKLGYKLIYRCDIQNLTKEQALTEFLKKEKIWMKERLKSKSQPE